MDDNHFIKEIKSLLFDIYVDLQKVDVGNTLHRTKKKLDLIHSNTKKSGETLNILNEASNLCFDLWAPMCENVLSTYQDIQVLLIPKLECLLDINSKTELEKLLDQHKIGKIDYTKLTRLPSLPITKHIWEDIEKDMPKFNLDDDKDFDLELPDFDDDFDDVPEREKYTYEDGPFCSACEQAPCMCSDPERTSTTFGY